MSTQARPQLRSIWNGRAQCECYDAQCPVGHDGKRTSSVSTRCYQRANVLLYRVDMIDASGTAFCQWCADDCYDSGLFTDSSE